MEKISVGFIENIEKGVENVANKLKALLNSERISYNTAATILRSAGFKVNRANLFDFVAGCSRSSTWILSACKALLRYLQEEGYDDSCFFCEKELKDQTDVFETYDNVFFICSSCSATRKKEWREHIKIWMADDRQERG